MSRFRALLLPLAGLALAAMAGVATASDPQPGAAAPPEPAAAPSAPDALPAEIVDVTWEWVSFTTPKEEILVEEPERYTLILAADGSVAAQIDCNRGTGSYTLAEDQGISIGPLGVTMMLCPDDQLGDRFVRELERVGSWFVMDGDFFLELPMDSGTFRFRSAAGN